jgi:predicted Rossmann fold flavoprotein
VIDVAVIGAGPSGMMSAIKASQNGNSVSLYEANERLGLKLLASGGKRCNISNMLSTEEFLAKLGKNGRFVSDALYSFDREKLVDFFDSIGVSLVSRDGFRIFPDTHSSTTVVNSLIELLKKENIDIYTNHKIISIKKEDDHFLLKSQNGIDKAKKVIIATGGIGYPSIGGCESGLNIAKSLSHSIVSPSPAMTPLVTKEDWTDKCRADTLSKVTLSIDIKKHSKLKATGDLIFTKDGIAGPVVLDFAREITPLLQQYSSVPILIDITDKNQEEIRDILKKPNTKIVDNLNTLLPNSLSKVICEIFSIEKNSTFNKIDGQTRDNLIKYIHKIPLNIISSYGYDKAMVMRGGIKTKEINPKTMQSKLVEGLYFCGEVVDIDGPCGGYNLQIAFSMGNLAGELLD